jgi:hypothetical protein
MEIGHIIPPRDFFKHNPTYVIHAPPEKHKSYFQVNRKTEFPSSFTKSKPKFP